MQEIPWYRFTRDNKHVLRYIGEVLTYAMHWVECGAGKHKGYICPSTSNIASCPLCVAGFSCYHRAASYALNMNVDALNTLVGNKYSVYRVSHSLHLWEQIKHTAEACATSIDKLLDIASFLTDDKEGRSVHIHLEGSHPRTYRYKIAMAEYACPVPKKVFNKLLPLKDSFTIKTFAELSEVAETGIKL